LGALEVIILELGIVSTVAHKENFFLLFQIFWGCMSQGSRNRFFSFFTFLFSFSLVTLLAKLASLQFQALFFSFFLNHYRSHPKSAQKYHLSPHHLPSVF